MAADRFAMLVATTKGAFLFRADAERRAWRVDGPHFLGHVVNHVVLDPRDRRTMLMAARTGHLGPTVFRSLDEGRSWKEAATPPRFPKTVASDGPAVESVFWLTPGHVSEPGVWFAGTAPHGLFRSDDGGVTWAPVAGFSAFYGSIRERPGVGGTPGGAITHSILVDPRDAKRLVLGLSVGGVFESLDTGATWGPLNAGVVADFVPTPDPELGQDPHCVVQHPNLPDRLWQQNHCGIYRIDRPAPRWTRIGDAMPRDVGDIGFPIVLHPRDVNTAWVFPMDGTDVWPRTSPGGRPAVFRTRDAGASWTRLSEGLPAAQGWFTVKRQAFAADAGDPVGLAFGTTSGELWTSLDEGESWTNPVRHLPHIYAVSLAELG